MRSKYLRDLRSDVNARLDASIHRAIFLDIGIKHDPSAVKPPWKYYNPEKNEDFSSLLDAFDKCSGRLLLLGAPGSGKTTALLHLTLDLIDRAEKDWEQPVPLLVNLSKFKFGKNSSKINFEISGSAKSIDISSSEVERVPHRTDFTDWLLRELTAFPGMDRKVAEDWFSEGRVATLADGLDEFNDDLRETLIKTLNNFYLRAHGDSVFVICSRINEYNFLRGDEKNKLELEGCVQLELLDAKQVKDYLIDARADALIEYLHSDDRFFELARTPLTLAMLVLAWSDGLSSKLSNSSSLSEQRYHLFSSYVQRMLQRQARREHNQPFDDVRSNDIPEDKYKYTPAEVNRYLGWLAVTMSTRMRSSFSEHSITHLLYQSNNPSKQKFNFWIMHSATSTFFLSFVLLISFAIGVHHVIDLKFLIASIFILWVSTPIIGVVVKSYLPESIFLAMISCIAASLTLSLLSNSMSLQVGILFPHDFAPIIAIFFFTLISAIAEFEKPPTKVIIAMVAVPAEVILARCCIWQYSYLVPPQYSIVDKLLPSVVGWAIIWLIILIQVSREASLVEIILFTILTISVVTGMELLISYSDILDPCWVFSAIMALLSAGYVGNSESFTATISWIVSVSFFTIVGGSTFGYQGFIYGAVFVVMLAAIIPRLGSEVIKRQSTSTGSKRSSLAYYYYLIDDLLQAFAKIVDKNFSGRIVWAQASIFGRFSPRKKEFLRSAADAFLVKKAGSDIEFSHRLLRDYFALRDLMPRLKPDVAGRLEAIRSLGFQGESALEVLVEYAQQPDVKIRAAAIFGLSHIQSPSAAEAVLQALPDQSRDVRFALLRAYHLLDSQTRKAIDLGLAPLEDESDVDVIVSLVIEGRYDFQYHVIMEKFGKLGIDRVAARLKQLRGNQKEKIIMLLGFANHPQVGRVLLAETLSQDPRYRRAALRAMQFNYTAHDYANEIQTLLRDKDAKVRLQAEVTLQSMKRFSGVTDRPGTLLREWDNR